MGRRLTSESVTGSQAKPGQNPSIPAGAAAMQRDATAQFQALCIRESQASCTVACRIYCFRLCQQTPPPPWIAVVRPSHSSYVPRKLEMAGCSPSFGPSWELDFRLEHRPADTTNGKTEGLREGYVCPWTNLVPRVPCFRWWWWWSRRINRWGVWPGICRMVLRTYHEVDGWILVSMQ